MDNVVISSPLLELLKLTPRTIAYSFPIVVIGVTIFASSVFLMLPQSEPAFATSAGENEKIAFVSHRDGDFEIFVMNATDGSGQTRLTNNGATDGVPDWSPDGEKIAFIPTEMMSTVKSML